MAKEGFRWMWILVFFDLPVVQKAERAAATKFRNNLLKDGYLMLQWSVYARVCNGLERVQKHVARLKQMVPSRGSIRVMTVTEQQFARMELLIGKPSPEEEMATKQLVLF
jgi:CRISPR-associated protein Cas2